MDSTFIKLESVRKSFGSVVAVDSVDLEIPKGAFFSLLGPSGCGKTTLLSMLGGLTHPTSGRILIDNVDVTAAPAHRRPTNMVFQSYAIFPHLSVADNIAYGLRRQGLTRAERDRRVEGMLEMIDLRGFGDRRPNQLSGGQMQRIALARALIVQPKVLLLDEPLSALDKRLRQNMQIELRALQREVGITFVFVTHDQEEALTLSDLVAVMSNGRVLQCSSPSELYETPVSREVAEFVGEMNILPAQVVSNSSGRIVVTMPSFGTISFERVLPGINAGDNVLVAVRPEQFRIEESGDATELPITNRAYFGDRTHLLLEAKGYPQPLLISVTAEQARRIRESKTPDRVAVRPDTENAVVLAS